MLGPPPPTGVLAPPPPAEVLGQPPPAGLPGPPPPLLDGGELAPPPPQVLSPLCSSLACGASLTNTWAVQEHTCCGLRVVTADAKCHYTACRLMSLFVATADRARCCCAGGCQSIAIPKPYNRAGDDIECDAAPGDHLTAVRCARACHGAVCSLRALQWLPCIPRAADARSNNAGQRRAELIMI